MGMGNNSSHIRVPDCNSPFTKRERNWAELAFAKTSGIVTGYTTFTTVTAIGQLGTVPEVLHPQGPSFLLNSKVTN